MFVRIKLAETADELDQLFRLRHRIFSEECRYAPAAGDRRLFDRFDAFPAVCNAIAVADGRVVGGLRIVEDCGLGLPADEYFDFTPHLPPRARVGSTGMAVIDPRHRGTQIFMPLAGVSHTWAARRGLTHLALPISPNAEHLGPVLGYEPLAPRFFNERLGLFVTPMLLDTSRMGKKLIPFLGGPHLEQVVHLDRAASPSDER